MKVLISGSHGLIGSALSDALGSDGDQVIRLVRGERPGVGDGIWWNPASAEIDTDALEGLDAVVHLAGENLASGRWTAARKSLVRSSRVDATRFLSETLAARSHTPKVLISASAVGYYGNRGDELLTEESAPGEGFLAEVCREWEAATAPAAEAGIRVAHLRFGIVLSRRGGALAKMARAFRIGLGGPLGGGGQFWSWIEMSDAIAAISFALTSSKLAGPVNLVSPEPVTNRDFSRTLGRALVRPAILPAPAFALRLMLGEMADAALLASARALPAKLQAAGFRFRYSELLGALRRALL